MKKNKIVALLLMVVMVFSQMSFAASVRVDGKNKSLDILTDDSRQYISVKGLADYGLSTLTKGGQITLSNHAVKFEFKVGSNAVKVNGVPMTLDSKPFVKNGQGYVPMRFVFETLNYDFGYNKSTKQMTLTRNKEAAYPVLIKDGDMVYRFTSPVKKVVSLAPSITEILFAIGAQDKLVGRTTYCTYPEAAKKIRSVGTLKEPDVEGILDLNADMVIAATHMNEDAMKLFKKAGVRTATQKSPENIEQIYALIENLGVLTEQAYPARALVSSLRSKQQRVEAIAASIPDDKKASVYYVVGTGKKEFTAGADTFINEIFTKAGAKNVAADVNGWAYTLEKLIDHNPEYIFGEAWAQDTMKGSRNYGSLSALSNGKFVLVEGNVFAIPGPRVIDEAMKLVVKKLYPNYVKQLKF